MFMGRIGPSVQRNRVKGFYRLQTINSHLDNAICTMIFDNIVDNVVDVKKVLIEKINYFLNCQMIICHVTYCQQYCKKIVHET